MAERFGSASVKDIEVFMQKSKNENTTKATNKWMRVYGLWAGYRNKSTNIHLLPPTELDQILQVFFAEIKKKMAMITNLNRLPTCKQVLSGI